MMQNLRLSGRFAEVAMIRSLSFGRSPIVYSISTPTLAQVGGNYVCVWCQMNSIYFADFICV